jgi:hypothetical protein
MQFSLQSLLMDNTILSILEIPDLLQALKECLEVGWVESRTERDETPR